MLVHQMLRIIATIYQLHRAGKGHTNLQTVPVASLGNVLVLLIFSPEVSLVLKIKGRNLMKHLTPGGQTVATIGLVFPQVNRFPLYHLWVKHRGGALCLQNVFLLVTAGEGGRASDSSLFQTRESDLGRQVTPHGTNQNQNSDSLNHC